MKSTCSNDSIPQIYIKFLILCVLCASLLPTSTITSTGIGYLLVVFSSIPIALAFIITEKKLYFDKQLGILIFAIFIVFLFHPLYHSAVGSLEYEEILRSITFITFFVIFSLIIPQIVPIDVFFRSLSYITTVIVVIGLPTAVIGEYSLFGLSIAPYPHNTALIGPLGAIVNPIRGITYNPNTFAFVICLSISGILSEIDGSLRPGFAWGLLLTNLSAAILTGSRAALGSIAIAVVIFVLYKIPNKYVSNKYVVSLVIYIILLVVTLGLYIEVSNIYNIVNLRGREYVWTAIWQALLDKPILGHGLGQHADFYDQYIIDDYKGKQTHNSYLRMLLTTGIIGGISYILIVVLSIRKAFEVLNSYRLSLVIALSIVAFYQFWVGFSLFGLTTQSVFSSIIIGYVITDPD